MAFQKEPVIPFPPENCQVPSPTGVILISVFPSGTVRCFILSLTNAERGELFVTS